MADQPRTDDDHTNRRTHFYPLPIETRRQLWQQIWNRLLAPPIDVTDSATDDVQPSELTAEVGSDVAA
jgi:hypothetical protein